MDRRVSSSRLTRKIINTSTNRTVCSSTPQIPLDLVPRGFFMRRVCRGSRRDRRMVPTQARRLSEADTAASGHRTTNSFQSRRAFPGGPSCKISMRCRSATANYRVASTICLARACANARHDQYERERMPRRPAPNSPLRGRAA